MNSYLKNQLEKKGFLIAAHRGTFKANIIENTFGSFNAALLEGADMVEIDLSRSTDGELYVYHDGGEKRVFHHDGSILDLDSKTIDTLRFHNQIDKKTGEHVLRIREYLDYVSKVDADFMINIDRCFEYFDQLLPILDEYDLHERILIKAPVVDELQVLNDYKTKFMFMAIVKTEEDLKNLEKYKDLNTVALELIVNDKLTYFDNKDLILDLKKQGYLIWLNAITLDDESPLFHTYDDNTVIKSMNFDAWETLRSYHADILQTDWVAIMAKYRDTISK